MNVNKVIDFKSNKDSFKTLDSFYNNGFMFFRDDEIASIIDVCNIEWILSEVEHETEYLPKNQSPILTAELTTVQWKLSEKYLTNFFGEHTVLKKFIWEGTNTSSMNWHNDKYDGAGHNVFILLYLSDMFEDGAIWFRSIKRKSEYRFLPKKYDFVLVHCDLDFEHRAEPSNIQRIIVNFSFKLDNLKESK
jgi:hypothetical protein